MPDALASTPRPAHRARGSRRAPGRAMISSERISKRVRQLGGEISEVYASIDTPLVIVAILKGATVFAADLLRSLSIPAELEFVRAASYGGGTRSSGRVKIAHRVEGALEGRHLPIKGEELPPHGEEPPPHQWGRAELEGLQWLRGGPEEVDQLLLVVPHHRRPLRLGARHDLASPQHELARGDQADGVHLAGCGECAEVGAAAGQQPVLLQAERARRVPSDHVHESAQLAVA